MSWLSLTGLPLVAASLAAGGPAVGAPPSAAFAMATASSKPPTGKAAVHHVSGTLESYDPAAKTITVKGTKETWTFDAAEARVWDGSRSVDLDVLAQRTGVKVTVKYTDEGGGMQARTVRVAGPGLSRSRAR